MSWACSHILSFSGTISIHFRNILIKYKKSLLDRQQQRFHYCLLSPRDDEYFTLQYTCHTFRQDTEQETLFTNIFEPVVKMQSKIDTNQYTVYLFFLIKGCRWFYERVFVVQGDGRRACIKWELQEDIMKLLIKPPLKIGQQKGDLLRESNSNPRTK